MRRRWASHRHRCPGCGATWDHVILPHDEWIPSKHDATHTCDCGVIVTEHAADCPCDGCNA